jgi:hypothetical protein
MGDWSFKKELVAGDRIVFLDMIHYTMVKTTTFNGVHHPSIGIWTKDNQFRLIREFGYEDYKNRLVIKECVRNVKSINRKVQHKEHKENPEMSSLSDLCANL